MSALGSALQRKFRKMVAARRTDERGATATEYSLLTSFVALVILGGVGIFGLALNGLFGDFTEALKTALGLP